MPCINSYKIYVLTDSCCLALLCLFSLVSCLWYTLWLKDKYVSSNRNCMFSHLIYVNYLNLRVGLCEMYPAALGSASSKFTQFFPPVSPLDFELLQVLLIRKY